MKTDTDGQTDAITILVHMRAKPATVDFVKSRLDELVASTREKAGCTFCHLHNDQHDHSHFICLEEWVSKAAWQEHMDSAEVTSFMKSIPSSLAYFASNELTQLI